MKFPKIRLTISTIALLAAYCSLGLMSAHAQSIKDYPNKSITLIVPFPPGEQQMLFQELLRKSYPVIWGNPLLLKIILVLEVRSVRHWE